MNLPQQKVNKNPKFDINFDIRCQLENFEYDMNPTLMWFQVLSMKQSNKGIKKFRKPSIGFYFAFSSGLV